MLSHWITTSEENVLVCFKITDLILPDGTVGGTEVLLKIPVCYD
jgi:hypothetical protein